MTLIENIRLYLEMFGYTAGVASVLFLAIQLRKERKLEEYKTLQALEEKYTTLLWKSSEQTEIDQAWKEIPPDRKQAFDALAKNGSSDLWPIWNGMTDEEQNCYRFTRSGLEILEQAYIAKKKGWIDDDEIKNKWEAWMISWRNTNSYVPYVLMEIDHWFTPSFIEKFNSLKK